VSSSRLAASASLSTSSSLGGQHEADLVVIGSGPGGYVGAIKAAQLGMKARERESVTSIDIHYSFIFYSK
jgi:alkyl hydroperoxide reductase subunit AhpF